ncbi:calcium-binding protein P-like [Galendromus occidentalis]|uniref:Calcium-binding protein P-like n=1 Tax=Galendromus occidentalis TaxID=34638 RepID=A0AAJ7PAR6_9ACAR|nr:calcium-binding protein P-like [Galendromus occidentalis]
MPPAPKSSKVLGKKKKQGAKSKSVIKKGRKSGAKSALAKKDKKKGLGGSILSKKSLLSRAGGRRELGGSKLLGNVKLGKLKKSQLVQKPMLEGTKRTAPAPMLRNPTTAQQPASSKQQPQQEQRQQPQQQQYSRSQQQQYQQQQQQQMMQQYPPGYPGQGFPQPNGYGGYPPMPGQGFADPSQVQPEYQQQAPGMPPAEWSPEQQSFVDPSQQYPGQAPNNYMGYNPYEAPQGGFQGQDPGYANPYGAPPYDPNAFDANVPMTGQQPPMGGPVPDWDPYNVYNP